MNSLIIKPSPEVSTSSQTNIFLKADENFCGLPASSNTKKILINPPKPKNYWYLDRILELRKIEKLECGWHANKEIDSPNSTSVFWADVALDILRVEDFSCDRVVASADEGVGICFVHGDKYADIEFFNTGEILAVTSSRNSEPFIWSVDPDPEAIRTTIQEICEYIER